MTDHQRGCEGRTYTCTCGYDDQLVRIGPDAVERATQALQANKQGWENVIEFALLPQRHHDTARALIEQCRAAIAALKGSTDA